MGLYQLHLPMSLLGFEMGTMLTKFHMYGVKSRFNMLVRSTSPRGPTCFRCLMFSLSGPCELLFLICFTVSWTRVVVSVMLYPCISCVALLMYLFVLCVCELPGETLRNMYGVVAILLLNIYSIHWRSF